MTAMTEVKLRGRQMLSEIDGHVVYCEVIGVILCLLTTVVPSPGIRRILFQWLLHVMVGWNSK